jgi:hypothetical protein
MHSVFLYIYDIVDNVNGGGYKTKRAKADNRFDKQLSINKAAIKYNRKKNQ